ncbi:hypothetical protein [Deinococcus koreensis]|uniref:Uncharacterized protein n=1 Tax=Deinococcus koreensis TaxID=2054903 RepID=A0A2K3UVP0_9DEIO|nr:hypothetical protein [Deinococcus koreensis]PNY80597.1 hypothetical protein CVO96_03765 [Deinococcus koreensis]
MRGMWLVPAALGLVACGSAPTPPLTGDLLGAPTTLNVSGRVVSAQATPTIQGDEFRVRVRVQAARPPLPALKVTGIFVVTDAGVWKAPVPSGARLVCGARMCLQGTATGPASGIQPGEDVQVVARLQDRQGREFWLRDRDVRVGGATTP